jgi:heme/copper-type cytochrome/quinol oxidase subunit 2
MTLGGCSEGVLDPKGPIAAAERLIMFNATAIMLAIVVPTIIGVFIVILVVAGSLWIMTNLNENMMMSPELMNLQMQR